jgi:hypothetical protein
LPGGAGTKRRWSSIGGYHRARAPGTKTQREGEDFGGWEEMPDWETGRKGMIRKVLKACPKTVMVAGCLERARLQSCHKSSKINAGL